jgi:hypothetical protein
MISGGTWRCSAILSEFRSPFLNGAQRSVNRKVQGSNLGPGAKCANRCASSAEGRHRSQTRSQIGRCDVRDYGRTTTALQRNSVQTVELGSLAGLRPS